MRRPACPIEALIARPLPTELCRRTGNCIRRIVLCVSPVPLTSTGVVVKTVVKRRGGEKGNLTEARPRRRLPLGPDSGWDLHLDEGRGSKTLG
jgi:hypothetical protein